MVYVNEAVQTPYGAGKVVSVRDKDVVVEPLHWRMAGGQKPSFYVSKSDLSTLFTAGDAVKTQFGSGRIKEAREDGIYVIVLNDWKLATGKSPVLYLPVDSFTREPKDVQSIVVGAKVFTTYGTGQITEIRDTDGIVVVTPDSWVLADGRAPVFYMNKKDVSPILAAAGETPTAGTESSEQSFESRMKRAIELKGNGTTEFKKNEFEKASMLYSQALTVMNYLGAGLSNDQKAAVFEQTVPCHNNMSLCCLRLNRFREAAEYANNSVQLVDALEQRIGSSRVWTCLEARGVTRDLLLKKWKRRAHYLLGKAYLGMLELKLARNNFRSALALIQDDPVLVKEANEIRQLVTTTSKKLDKQSKNEKNMWSKAFKKRKEEQHHEEKLKQQSPASAAVGSPQQQQTGNTTKGAVDPSDFDLSQFGIGKANKSANTGAVVKGSNGGSSNLWMGGLFMLFTVGLIGGFTFLRFRK